MFASHTSNCESISETARLLSQGPPARHVFLMPKTKHAVHARRRATAVIQGSTPCQKDKPPTIPFGQPSTLTPNGCWCFQKGGISPPPRPRLDETHLPHTAQHSATSAHNRASPIRRTTVTVQTAANMTCNGVCMQGMFQTKKTVRSRRLSASYDDRFQRGTTNNGKLSVSEAATRKMQLSHGHCCSPTGPR